MKHILKTLTLAIVAIMTFSCLSSCTKNNSTKGYSFEYTNVSFDTEKNPNAETYFNLLKENLKSSIVASTDEGQLITLSDGFIVACNHRGINAKITLKKNGSTIKEWTLEAKSLWIIDPADPE